MRDMLTQGWRYVVCGLGVLLLLQTAFGQNRIIPKRINKPIWFQGTQKEWDDRQRATGVKPDWFSGSQAAWSSALTNPDTPPAGLNVSQAEWQKLIKSDGSAGIYVEIFADGDIKAVASGSENEQSARSGSIGIMLESYRTIYHAAINIASDQDEIRSGVSNIVINPTAGPGLSSAFISMRRPRIPEDGWVANLPLVGKYAPSFGIGGYLAASSSQWATEDTSVAAVPAVVVGAGVNVSYDFVNATVNEDNHVGLRAIVGLAWRRIGGDIVSEDELRTEIVGTSKRRFFGPEIQMIVTFRSVSASASAFLLRGGKSAPGITKGQLGGTVNVSVPIFSAYSTSR